MAAGGGAVVTVAVTAVAAVARLFAAVEARDLEPMWAVYAEDVVLRDAPSLPHGGEFHGHRGVARHGLRYARAWDPLQAPEDRALEPEIAAADGRIFVRWRQRARRADGVRLDLPAITAYRLRDGRIVDAAMHHFDTAALVAFLGWAP